MKTHIGPPSVEDLRIEGAIRGRGVGATAARVLAASMLTCPVPEDRGSRAQGRRLMARTTAQVT